jgi:hypothetical protein
VLSVLDAREAGKEGVARPLIRRQGRHDERKARLSIWIDDSCVLRGQDSVCCITWRSASSCAISTKSSPQT